MRTMIVIILALTLLAGVAYATDFSKYTTDELLGLRGTMWNATIEERTALHTELSKRVPEMTEEQKKEFSSRPALAGRGMGRGGGIGRGMGYGPYCPYRTN
ncbi:MAG: DUF1104 domain-containing protein [Nitrospirae bacterium]|nr:DUF1104 domain-containing protein [Nitrospirota bacterium]MBF0535665.1 DUF1104 domain-containing protein [Nitrospirota bacterium]MBF0616971.1 DUF1104 domain-containing protein [Nitrospirota bacterium]